MSLKWQEKKEKTKKYSTLNLITETMYILHEEGKAASSDDGKRARDVGYERHTKTT